jgi:hypothetical protein
MKPRRKPSKDETKILKLCSVPAKTTNKSKCPYIVKEHKELTKQFDDMNTKIDYLHNSVTEPIELINGKTQYLTQKEAIKDSWENIKKVQEHLDIIDTRTVFLQDIHVIWTNFVGFRNGTSKYLKPIGKFLYRSALTIIGLYVLTGTLEMMLHGKANAFETLRIIFSFL